MITALRVRKSRLQATMENFDFKNPIGKALRNTFVPSYLRQDRVPVRPSTVIQCCYLQ